MSARQPPHRSPLEHLFVYGTLRAGGASPAALRLAARATLRGAARVRGRLYQLGAYPGLVLGGEEDGWVPGNVYALASPADAILAELDAYEGCGAGDPEPHAFARVRAAARLGDGAGLEVWLYEYRAAAGAAPRIAEWSVRAPGATRAGGGAPAMPIEQELNEILKSAMREKDQPTLDVVRMLKARVAERRTAKGFSGTIDDALLVEVIGAYRKQMQKALEEYVKLGERGEDQAAKLRFEIDFCGRFLPATMGDDALRALVAERIAALGVTDVKQVGRLVGDVMKSHKGQVEAADVKRVAEELLVPTS